MPQRELQKSYSHVQFIKMKWLNLTQTWYHVDGWKTQSILVNMDNIQYVIQCDAHTVILFSETHKIRVTESFNLIKALIKAPIKY